MAAIYPPYLIPASPNPDIERYGLFKVATGPLDMPVSQVAEAGLEYQSPICVLPNGYTVACPPNNLSLTDQLSTIIGEPFMVVADTLCGTLGHTEAEWQSYVLKRLYAGEQATVERIFSDGLNGAGPSLANNTPNVTMLPAQTTIDGAIDALESWLYAQYGPAGVLHIPISANSAVYSDFHILRDTDGILYTPMGTKVVFGNYSGSAADGTAPATGHTTFYITGQVAIWRDTPFVSPYGASIDKVTNQIRMFAERAYVLTYDCYAAGVDVTLSGEP